MKRAPSSAAMKVRAWKCPAPSASEVPTSTGATAAGSVRTRAAITQMRTALKLGPLGEAGEVRGALLHVGIPALLGLLAFVEQQVRVVGELLDAAEPFFSGVEAGLQQTQGERRQGQHLPAPADRLLLEALERHDGVDEPHRERLLGGVPAAQEPDLLGLLRSHEVRQQTCPE